MQINQPKVIVEKSRGGLRRSKKKKKMVSVSFDCVSPKKPEVSPKNLRGLPLDTRETNTFDRGSYITELERPTSPTVSSPAVSPLPEFRVLFNVERYFEKIKAEHYNEPESPSSLEGVQRKCLVFAKVRALRQLVIKVPSLEKYKMKVCSLFVDMQTQIDRLLEGTTLQSELTRHCLSQYFIRDEMTVCYYPNQKHAGRNEDAFKHDTWVTVVADGLGFYPFSESASRIVVDAMHKEASAISKAFSNQDVNEQVVQKINFALRSACHLVSNKLKAEMRQLGSGATCAVEVRVLDKEQAIHRFMLFVGDSNVLFKNEKEAIFLNPLTYSTYRPSEFLYQYDQGIPTLTFLDLKALQTKEKDVPIQARRNVTNSRGAFVSGNVPGEINDQSCVIVYVSPEYEGETILMTDGITDRGRVSEISLCTAHHAFIMEDLINGFYMSGEFSNKVDKWLGALINLEGWLGDNVFEERLLPYFSNSEREQFKPMKKTHRKVPLGFESVQQFSDKFDNALVKMLVGTGVSNAPFSINNVSRYLYWHWKNGRCNETVRRHLAETIVLGNMGLFRLGYTDVRKWDDDSTYVSTTAPDVEVLDIKNCMSLPFIAKQLIKNGRQLLYEDFLKILTQIKLEYDRAAKRDFRHVAGTRDYIRQCLYEVACAHGRISKMIKRLPKLHPLRGFLCVNIQFDCENPKNTLLVSKPKKNES